MKTNCEGALGWKSRGDSGDAWGMATALWECDTENQNTLAKRSPAVEFEDLLQVKGSWILELGNVAD